MSAIPSFSSTDGIESHKTSDVTQVQISDQDFDWYFEVEPTVSWINANNFKKVALQFPDELLNSAPKLCHRLEKSLNCKPYLLADTSYGSCCVDDIAAQHVDADCVIHYGEACMSKVQSGRGRVKYVLPKKSLNLHIFGQRLKRWLDEQAPGATFRLFLDSCYLHYRDEIASLLATFGFSDDVIRENLHFASSINDDLVLFVGSERSKRASLLALTNPTSTFFLFDPHSDEEPISSLDFSANRTLRKRLYLTERAKDARIVGIVIGTVNVSDYMQILERMKFLCKNTGKKSYVLYVGKLNVAKLSNFSEIDVFVLLSCPFGVVFDWSDYPKPIVTPFEFSVACDPNFGGWWANSGWRPDPISVLAAPDDKIEHENHPETDFSLTGGRLRNLHISDTSTDGCSLITRNEAFQIQPVSAEDRFNDRSWKGLEEKIGETPVSEIKEGRKGVASAYDDEDF